MESLYGGDLPAFQVALHLVFGLLFTFTGYALYRCFIRAYGLTLGLYIGIGVGALMQNVTVAVVGAAALGALGFLFIPVFYFIGLFLTGGIALALLLTAPISALGLDSRVPEVGAGLVGLVLGGLIAVRFEKAIMVALTALCGVLVTGAGLNSLGIEWLFLGSREYPGTVVFHCPVAAVIVRVVLLAGGIACQAALMRKLDRRKPITEYW